MAGNVTGRACSFCRRPESKCKRLIENSNGTTRICDLCVRMADTPMATVAYCAGCTTVNGKHHENCKQEKEIA